MNHPRIERINGEYRYVGLMADDGEWIEIKPHQGKGFNHPDLIGSNNPWLEVLGPGKLVFIPDQLEGNSETDS